jgi:hypothetical protein
MFIIIVVNICVYFLYCLISYQLLDRSWKILQYRNLLIVIAAIVIVIITIITIPIALPALSHFLQSLMKKKIVKRKPSILQPLKKFSLFYATRGLFNTLVTDSH